MPMSPTAANLYQPPTKGFFIYHARKNGDQRWSANRKYSNGRTRSALCYSLEEAREFLDALPDEYTPAQDVTHHPDRLIT
jgi:hypothetical protein